jgi:HEPN domain-containing protein
LSSLEGRDLAKVLARKAEGDAKVARKLAPDPGIDDEAIGFHAQQAIEKWLKAVMAALGLEEARIHDLGRLMELLGEANVDLPPGADWLHLRSSVALRRHSRRRGARSRGNGHVGR